MTQILVVDDDRAIRRLIFDVFKRHSYGIDEATNGQEAIDLLDQRQYDVILLDLMMPVRSGYEVIEHLKKNPSARKNIIILTAAGARGVRSLDMDLVHTVLHKPFELEILIECVKECVAASGSKE